MSLDPRKHRIVARVARREANKFLLGKRLKNTDQAWFMNRLYRRAHKIIGPSESTRQLFIESGILASRVEVIHNGTLRSLSCARPTVQPWSDLEKNTASLPQRK